jgi:A/G-specific adenine glycosylase
MVQFGGDLPRRLEDLLALPGVGAYTARAVGAFAHEDQVGVLDTNVARVLARTEGRPLKRPEAQDLADRAVPPRQAWAWNQALMDLGARHCRSRDPRCPSCPIRTCCAWYVSQGLPDPARGSAGVSGGQSRFEGSDRQGRGRLVAALRAGPVPVADLARVMGWPENPGRAATVAATVLADGLAELDGGCYRLP